MDNAEPVHTLAKAFQMKGSCKFELQKSPQKNSLLDATTHPILVFIFKLQSLAAVMVSRPRLPEAGA